MIYLIGHKISEAVPWTGEALDPRVNGSGKRMWQVSQMRLSHYLAAFSRVNAVDQPQLSSGDHAIVLGREAMMALGVRGHKVWPMFASKVNPQTGVRTTLIPHPSGRNRLYNDASVRRRVREILSEALAREIRRVA